MNLQFTVFVCELAHLHKQIQGSSGKLPNSHSACYCLCVALLFDPAAEPHVCFWGATHTPIGKSNKRRELQMLQNTSFYSVPGTPLFICLYSLPVFSTFFSTLSFSPLFLILHLFLFLWLCFSLYSGFLTTFIIRVG